jgi:hypothetical protein
MQIADPVGAQQASSALEHKSRATKQQIRNAPAAEPVEKEIASVTKASPRDVGQNDGLKPLYTGNDESAPFFL